MAPSLYRFIFPPSADLFVLNDSGPALTNLAPFYRPSIEARVNDWAYTQFFPESCDNSDPYTDQPAEFVKWSLDNDNGYRGALYSSDGDSTMRFFNQILSPAAFRNLLLDTWDPIVAAYPQRIKRFIRPASSSHTAIGGLLYYTLEVNGITLYQWISDFVDENPHWVDNVGTP
jgi:hypothetical protein